jgi:hypothetical protein
VNWERIDTSEREWSDSYSRKGLPHGFIKNMDEISGKIPLI